MSSENITITVSEAIGLQAGTHKLVRSVTNSSVYDRKTKTFLPEPGRLRVAIVK